MKTIDRLQRDHELLRSKLSVAESAWSLGPEVGVIMRQVCVTLLSQLEDHRRREAEVIAAYREALRHEPISVATLQHSQEPLYLQVITKCFAEDPCWSLAKVRPALMALVGHLRRGMDAQEAELFPRLARVIPQAAVRDLDESIGALHATGHRHVPPPALDETMTVDCVLQTYPETKPVFDRLFIDGMVEGYDGLDEVALRHGMESAALLAQLEQAIASDPRPAFVALPMSPERPYGRATHPTKERVS